MRCQQCVCRLLCGLVASSASFSLARALQDDVPFARAFDLVQEYMQQRFLIPTWRLPCLWSRWVLLPASHCLGRLQN